MIATKELSGNCPCCGHSVEHIEYFFHAATGTLIIDGRVLRLTQVESVFFSMLSEVHPGSVSFRSVSARLNSGRRDGGSSPESVRVGLINFRKKLMAVDLKLINHYGTGAYSLRRRGAHTSKQINSAQYAEV